MATYTNDNPTPATGIVGTVLGATALAGVAGLLNGNGISGILGGRQAATVEYATKSDLQYAQELAKKDSEIALLRSEQNTEVKIADVYERVMTRVNSDQRAQATWNAQQSVNNAQMSAAIAANAQSIAALQNCCSNITKIVVPNTSVCPGWGNVTITPAASTTTPVTGG